MNTCKQRYFLNGLVCILSVLWFSGFLFPPSIFAAGAPMVIDDQSRLPNGFETEVKGTVQSVDDLSNGNLNVKLLTKSETDPSEVAPFLLDGPIEVGTDSTFTVLKGSPITQMPTRFKFQVQENDGVFPEVLISNVAKTKAGQHLDVVVSVTGVHHTEENESFFNIGTGSAGAIYLGIANVGGVNVSYQFLDSLTRQPVDILMFPTISDIDYTQRFGLNAKPLGYGSNLKYIGNGKFESDGTPTNGFNDFPLGGALYQFYGNKIISSYDSTSNGVPDKKSNGFEIFGAYGTINNIELVKPDFGEVEIPKASWEVDESTYQPGQKVQAAFVQPINALDVDINHRYANWDTTFTLSQEIKNPTVKLVDEKGQVLPAAVEDLGNGQFLVSVTQDTMKQLAFAGETYRFIIEGTLDPKLIDGSTFTYQAHTNIDGQENDTAYTTKAIAHKVSVKVKYLRQDSTDSVSPTKVFAFGYGKAWEVNPIEAPDGYYFDSASTKDELSGEKADFLEKTVVCYYAPVEKQIYVNYLDESGNKLASSTLTANYQDAYTTTAKDLDDEYSLMMDRLPDNAYGIVGNTDITVNYYYRQTRGYWLDLGYDSRGITRVDYHGHIRSNTMNYADGQILTLINQENGILLYQDTVDDGAVSEKSLQAGESHTISVTKDDTMTVEVSGIGQALITRKTPTYTMTTQIQQGNFDNTTHIYAGNQVIEEQQYKANGVTGIILHQAIKQWIDGKYQVVAQKVVDEEKALTANTASIDAPATEYLTLLDGAEETQETEEPKETTAKVTSKPKSLWQDLFTIPIAYAEEEPNVTENLSEDIDQEDVMVENDATDQEDVMAENDATFSTTILGSASLPPNEAAVFDEQDSAGDLEDETHTYQGLLNEYDVSVYEDTDLLQQARIPEDDMLMVELPAAEEREEPVTLAVQPQAENLQTGQKKKDGEIVPIQDGKLPALGERSSILYVGIGLLCLGSALFFFIRRRKQRQGGKPNA